MDEKLELLLADGVIDEIHGRLKSGKEADIWIVNHGGEIVAAKIYKERQTRSFKNNAAYKEGRVIGNSRTQRAIDRGSRFGQAAAEEAWKSAEADALYKLHANGVRTPTPVMFYEGVLLMQLVVDAEGNAAPRLIEAELTPEVAGAMYRDLRQQVVRMLDADIIHGDLSPYNVLLGAAGPTIIDFPQIIAAAANNRAEPFFERDLENLRRHLMQYDPSLRTCSGDAHEIWRAYVRRELTPDFVPSERPPPEPREARGHGRAHGHGHAKRERQEAQPRDGRRGPAQQEGQRSRPQQEPGRGRPQQDAGRGRPQQEPAHGRSQQDGPRNRPQQEPAHGRSQQDGPRNRPQQEPAHGRPQQDGPRNRPQQEPAHGRSQQDAARSRPQQDSARDGARQNPNRGHPQENGRAAAGGSPGGRNERPFGKPGPRGGPKSPARPAPVVERIARPGPLVERVTRPGPVIERVVRPLANPGNGAPVRPEAPRGPGGPGGPRRHDRGRPPHR